MRASRIVLTAAALVLTLTALAVLSQTATRHQEEANQRAVPMTGAGSHKPLEDPPKIPKQTVWTEHRDEEIENPTEDPRIVEEAKDDHNENPRQGLNGGNGVGGNVGGGGSPGGQGGMVHRRASGGGSAAPAPVDRERYESVNENTFLDARRDPLSTFSIDVDTASYANVRRLLSESRRIPDEGAVRIEELINYFSYDYPQPTDEHPFSVVAEVATCPWDDSHQLVHFGIQGRRYESDEQPPKNLVFLADVSGSMNRANKIGLLKEGLRMLAASLTPIDRVAIVVYAGAAGLVLPSTSGGQQGTILAALDRLSAGGSTNGGAGIQLAYQVAEENFIEGGINRVVLCTDGDFNVGNTGDGSLVELIEEKRETGVFLSVLGFGQGNLNDSMMEKVSNAGNGNYYYIDNQNEARKVLVQELSATLFTIAKDVKIQVEFNPAEVGAYRLIGYVNRKLAAEDFNDDKKDAGEIGAGHSVTALYEIVPAGLEGEIDTGDVDDLRYQDDDGELTDAAQSGELLTVKLRYKQPDEDESQLVGYILPKPDELLPATVASTSFRWSAAVAAFGMLLSNSEHAGTATYDSVYRLAMGATGPDPFGYRAEFLELVDIARELDE